MEMTYTDALLSIYQDGEPHTNTEVYQKLHCEGDEKLQHVYRAAQQSLKRQGLLENTGYATWKLK